MSLIRGLPPRSAVHRATDPEWWAWGFSEEILADLLEMVDLSNRLFVQAHSKQGTRQPEPLRVPRPYDRPEPKHARTQATSAEVLQFFGTRKAVKS